MSRRQIDAARDLAVGQANDNARGHAEKRTGFVLGDIVEVGFA